MKRQIAGLVLAMFLVYLLAVPAGAAPLFPDVPDNHWARDAVADLASKGIIEGYPSGTFKGDRAVTRWEMALMIQRLLAKMSAEHAKFAAKADLEALRALVNEYKDELNAIGVRVTNLEEHYRGLDMRTRELEKIRFYGYVHTMLVGMDIRGSLDDAGSRAVPVVDWSNGRVLQNGSGFSGVGKLGTVVNPGKDFTFGLEIAGYYSTGDQVIDQYWGVNPPYLSNPFTATGSAAPGIMPSNNTPWNRVTLDRFWFRYKPLKTLLTVGSFEPEIMERTVLYGQRNPNINLPDRLPFYGIDVKGLMGKRSDFSYEVLYSQLAQASFYQTNAYAGTVKYKFKNGEVKLHFLNARNSEFGDGVNQGVGGVVLPAYPVSPGNAAIYWRTKSGLINNSGTGPQNVNVFGINIDYKFNKNWMGYAKFASSDYDPDTTNRIYDESATGNLFNIGVKVEYDKVRGNLEYISVENDYNPFVLQYPGPNQGIPVFLPYSTYYFNYYQLHDYIRYPNNRQGGRLSLEYDFTKKTTAGVSYNYLEQVKASTVENFTKVGSVEPLFSYLQGGGTKKGNVQEAGLWLRHDFGKLKGKIGYNYFLQRRDAVRIDDVDLHEDLLYLNLQYPLNQKLDLSANYYYINYSGHNGTANLGFRQNIPSISANYNFDKNMSIGATYRYYSYEDTETKDADWNAGQFLMEYKLKF